MVIPVQHAELIYGDGIPHFHQRLNAGFSGSFHPVGNRFSSSFPVWLFPALSQVFFHRPQQKRLRFCVTH